MIGGIIKYFRLTYNEILWERSYANINMLLATIPVFETDEDKKKKKEEQVTDLADIFKDQI